MELICEDPAGSLLLEVALDLCKVIPEDAILLGSPLVDLLPSIQQSQVGYMP